MNSQQLFETTAKEFSSSQVNHDNDMINLLNGLLKQAITRQASDIHLEQREDICVIRFRIDGSLQVHRKLQTAMAEQMISRLKVLAKIDITEKRLPQDGRFSYMLRGKKIDIRISSCPTFFGEKLVLRILTNNVFSLDTLGLTHTQTLLFKQALSRTQGLILLTGPTGCGKTTSLYAGLSHLNYIDKNIMTVEDPVEMILTGINQIQVNEKINLSFSQLLRFLLRQDPDVLMVGEIRDQETAEVVLQAAETGHVVLSSLHANSSISAINRLASFGLTHEAILSAITLVISQRLLRKLCLHCKSSPSLKKPDLGPRAVGCDLCHEGYFGRTAIYEFLPVTSQVKELLRQNKFDLPLARLNLRSMQDYGMSLVKKGITTLDEYQRVLG